MKRGQLSYEYILVIGMVLVLMIPFFYVYAKGLTGDVSAAANQQLVNNVAQAIETVVNLGGGTTSLRVVGEIKNIQSASAAKGGSTGERGSFTLTTNGGKSTYSSLYSGANVYTSTNLLSGSGAVTIDVTKSLRPNSVAVSTQGNPVIVAICRDLSLDAILVAKYPQCTDDPNQPLTITPSGTLKIIGANLQGLDAGTQISLLKTSAQQLLIDCTTNAQCPANSVCLGTYCSTTSVPLQSVNGLQAGQEQFVVQSSTAATGTGTYLVGVTTVTGTTSAWQISVNPSQGQGGGQEE